WRGCWTWCWRCSTQRRAADAEPREDRHERTDLRGGRDLAERDRRRGESSRVLTRVCSTPLVSRAMLTLRRGTVVEAGPAAFEQRVDIEVDGERRPAIADVGLVGACTVGDDVVVNTAAVDLGLGSGGFDVVHVNL